MCHNLYEEKEENPKNEKKAEIHALLNLMTNE
jgi:hypothetical protein